MFKSNTSLTIRLGAIVALSFFVTSLIVSAGMLRKALEKQNDQRQTELTATANILAASLSASIAEGDRNAVHSALRAVSYSDWIDVIAVYDRRGDRLAVLGSQVRLVSSASQSDTHSIWDQKAIEVEVDVRERGETVGQLRVAAKGLDLSSAIRAELFEVLLWSLIAALVGGGSAIYAQRSMLRPMVDLAEQMSGTNGAAGARPDPLKLKGKGEVGVLIDAYNRMISGLAVRDDALARHRDNLENEVNERTHELQLARVDAEQANEAKSRFLATMSHEIRTPMNGVLVMAELLARSPLPAAQRGYASVITRSGNALLNLLNDLLDFSKIEAGHLELESIPIPIDELVDDVAMLFWQRAREKGIAIIPYIAPDVPQEVIGDPTRLRQCLANLVGNAVKFTNTGAISIAVEWMANGTDGTGELRIGVHDTGEGIPEDRVDAIFEAFTQADQATTRKHGGTGLGLSITHQLITAMGGAINVTSTLGEGSLFLVRLPQREISSAAPKLVERPQSIWVDVENPHEKTALVTALRQRGVGIATSEHDAAGRIVSLEKLGPARDDLSPAILYWRLGEADPADHFRAGVAHELMAIPSGRRALEIALSNLARGELRGASALDMISDQHSEALPTFTSARILVADDNEANRMVISSALGLLDVSPVLVEDGVEALNALSKEQFDLVLLDGHMPNMSGFEAAGAIRADGITGRNGASLPLLLFSATPPEEAKLADTGFDDFLPKPFELDDLAATLARVLPDWGARVRASKSDEPVVKGAERRVLDKKTFAMLKALDSKKPGTFRKVCERFLGELPNSVERILDAHLEGDLEALASAAHALKSMTGTIGASALWDLAGKIEAIARAAASDGEDMPDFDEIPRLAATVRELSARIETELDKAA